MLILFICFILELVALVCYAVNRLIAEAFSDPNWLEFGDQTELSDSKSAYLDNSEFEYGHDVEYRIKESL